MEGGYFAKPDLDDMGPGTDMERPVRKPSPKDRGETRSFSSSPLRGEDARRADEGASLFHKPTLDDMGRDIAEPAPRGQSLFRKNSLDEMTVRRTEKPAASGPLPEKPADPSAKPREGDSKAASGADRLAAPGGAMPKDDGFRPILRAKTGVGSYEDLSDARKKGKGKTGKPGA